MDGTGDGLSRGVSGGGDGEGAGRGEDYLDHALEDGLALGFEVGGALGGQAVYGLVLVGDVEAEIGLDGFVGGCDEGATFEAGGVDVVVDAGWV